MMQTYTEAVEIVDCYKLHCLVLAVFLEVLLFAVALDVLDLEAYDLLSVFTRARALL